MEINSLGTSEDRQRYRAKLVKWPGAGGSARSRLSERLITNPLRILDSKNTTTQALADAPTLLEALSEESAARFAEVQRLLHQLAIPFQVNIRLVRGLDYYCHTAFEITSDKLGAQATVCGGGRYDSLVEQLGGSPTPAIGWALGMERLLLVLEAAAKADPNGAAARLTAQLSPTVYLVNRGEAAEAAALGLARNLGRLVLSWNSTARELPLANSSNEPTVAVLLGSVNW